MILGDPWSNVRHRPLAVANAVVSLDPGRTAMAVNKLVHLVHGWSLAHGRGIVDREAEVWRYGPVYREVYEAFMRFGHHPIGMGMPFADTMEIPAIDPDDRWSWELVSSVVSAHRADDACRLSEICHAPDSPWRRVAEDNGYRVAQGTTVPEAYMAEHFMRLRSVNRGTKAAR